MKFISSPFHPIVIVFFLMTISAFQVRAQKEEEGYPFNWNLNMQGGLMFKDQSGLSELLFNDADGLNSNLYMSTGAEFKIELHRAFLSVSGQRGSYSEDLSNGDALSVVDGLTRISLGYGLLKDRSIQLVPQLGMAIVGSNINYSISSAQSNTSVTGVLAGPASTHLLKVENYYARLALDFTYNMGKGDYYKYFPLEVGLTAEYLYRVSDSNWKSGLDSKLEGPNVFDSSFYLGFSIGWWILEI